MTHKEYQDISKKNIIPPTKAEIKTGAGPSLAHVCSETLKLLLGKLAVLQWIYSPKVIS